MGLFRLSILLHFPSIAQTRETKRASRCPRIRAYSVLSSLCMPALLSPKLAPRVESRTACGIGFSYCFLALLLSPRLPIVDTDLDKEEKLNLGAGEKARCLSVCRPAASRADDAPCVQRRRKKRHAGQQKRGGALCLPAAQTRARRAARAVMCVCLLANSCRRGGVKRTPCRPPQ